MSATESLISVRDLSVHYGNRHALQSVSGQFHAGSLTAVAGPNGSGKSTLLKTLAGVIRPSSGEITFAHGRRPQMAYLPQASHLLRDFPISVEEVVLTGYYPRLGEKRSIRDKHRAEARKALREVGLDGFSEREIGGLSGGEFQRVLFARVIVQNASVILLDEPFTAVDAETTSRLIKLLLKWHKEKRTVICVLHDLLLIQKYFPDSMVLQGKCLGSGHTHKMFEQKLLSFDLDMAELRTAGEDRDPSHAHHGHDH
ncbi:MAG: ABC transporter ATP-binding protein [Bdellovibrionales bacterium]